MAPAVDPKLMDRVVNLAKRRGLTIRIISVTFSATVKMRF